MKMTTNEVDEGLYSRQLYVMGEKGFSFIYF